MPDLITAELPENERAGFLLLAVRRVRAELELSLLTDLKSTLTQLLSLNSLTQLHLSKQLVPE